MKLTCKLTQQEKLTILTDSYEPGYIDYWVSEFTSHKTNSDGLITEFQITAQNEQDVEQSYIITCETIQLGIDRIMSGKCEVADHIKNYILTDNNDADSCDCIIQAGLFGKLVYG